MLRSRFAVDGTDLNSPGRRIVMAGIKLHGPEDITVANIRLPGRDGIAEAPSTRTVGASKWSLDITVLGDTYERMLDNKAELEALLSPPRRMVTLSETLLRGITPAKATAARTMQARAMLTGTEMVSPWGGDNHSARLRYDFTVPAGVWTDPAASTVSPGAGRSTLSALIGGSAPQVSPIITATPSGSALSWRVTCATCPDSWVSLDATGLKPGAPVVVDLGTDLAVQGDQLRVFRFVDEGPEQPHICPHGIVDVTLNGAPYISITSRRAWY